jgi:hypothetical protein
MAASTIIAGVGAAAAVAGTAGSMMSSSGGGGGGYDMDAVMAMLQQNQASGRDAINDYYGKATGFLAPWRNAGGTALNQQGGLLGLPGYTALDPTKTLEGTPGYQFLANQGTEALRRYGAGTGMLSSGPGMKGALNYGQNLAQTYAWAPYMSSLQNLSGQGLVASGQSGQYAMQAGGQLAGLYSGMGGTQAQYGTQQAMMDMNAQNAKSNDWMSMAGYGAKTLGSSGGWDGVTDWLGTFGAMENQSGALNSMPGLSLGQLSNVGGGGSFYGAYNAQPGGGWMAAPSTKYEMTGPYMANGGPTEAGRPYIVGERGPEWFIPSTHGYVVPNEYTRYSSFGGRG